MDTVNEKDVSTVSPTKPPEISPISPSDSKKMKMEEGYNLTNAIMKGRDEVNFYCGQFSYIISVIVVIYSC